MDFDTGDTGEIKVCVVEDLSIYQVASLLHTFKQALSGEELDGVTTIIFDLEAVPECDTAGLQLLLAMRFWAQEKQLDFRIDALSDAVRDQVDLFRAHSLLGLQALIPAQQEGGQYAG